MVKRLFDIVFSFFCLIALSPALLIIAILIKLDSDGPVLYRQERLGLYACPYTILKFRTMYKDAETDVPQLSAKGDKRVTRLGLVLRKFRLDELPQLWNILAGEMSFVGPRPERKYYVDQIVRMAPQYMKLYLVKPGLSSWGMVKFGYASDLSQMIERMKYDLLYVEKKSMMLDFKIMALTVKTVLTGKGI